MSDKVPILPPPHEPISDSQGTISGIWHNWFSRAARAVNSWTGSGLDYVNVRDYGAVGDGVTDDTAAFSAAYTDATDGVHPNGIVIPAGNYHLAGIFTENEPAWWIKRPGATFPTVTDMLRVTGNSGWSTSYLMAPADGSGALHSDNFEYGADTSTGNHFAEYQSWHVVTASTANYEKAYLYQTLVQHDVSNVAGPSLDLVNMDLRNQIPSANPHGRIWNLYLQCLVSTGADGEVRNVEIACDNYAAVGISNPQSTFGKVAVTIVPGGVTPFTAAHVLAGNGPGVYKGFYAFSTGSLANSTASSFLEYQNKFRVDYDGYITCAGQIGFPATQAPSADANTLDDYEEGTWTPIYVASGMTVGTYNLQAGYYTKVGRMVQYNALINTSSVAGGGANTLTVGGLPFTNAGSYQAAAVGFTQGFAADHPSEALVAHLSSNLELYFRTTLAGASNSVVQSNDMTTGLSVGKNYLIVGGSYHV